MAQRPPSIPLVPLEPLFPLSHPGDVLVCSICRELIGSFTAQAVGCGHVFHEKCLTQWSESRIEPLTCPTCRGLVKFKLRLYFETSEDERDQLINELKVQLVDCQKKLNETISLLESQKMQIIELTQQNRAYEESVNAYLRQVKSIKEANAAMKVQLEQSVSQALQNLDSKDVEMKKYRSFYEAMKEEYKNCENEELDTNGMTFLQLVLRVLRRNTVIASENHQHLARRYSKLESENNKLRVEICDLKNKRAADATIIKTLREALRKSDPQAEAAIFSLGALTSLSNKHNATSAKNKRKVIESTLVERTSESAEETLCCARWAKNFKPSIPTPDNMEIDEPPIDINQPSTSGLSSRPNIQRLANTSTKPQLKSFKIVNQRKNK